MSDGVCMVEGFILDINVIHYMFNIPAETYYLWKEKLENGYDGTKTFRERTRKIDKKKLEKTVEEKPDAFLFSAAS
jgi:transposase